MENKNLEYNLPNDAYVNFDAVSLKTYMIEQLNNSGKFSDQNYEGSNISSILDILAYYTHVLMFYLNQTSSESMFSQADIYENMNRIVKLIDYKPIGKQTSLCSLHGLASKDLPLASYNIRKYSYFLIDNIQYTFLKDFQFEKVSNLDENIESLNDNVILYQGRVGEYPTYIAEGIEYETFPIVVDNLVSTTDNFISHGSISVYVKEHNDGLWYEYSEVDTLFLNNSVDRIYSLRLNENGYYEVKMGNGIFGRRMNALDEIKVFYILSDGDKGIISKNAINGNKLFLYNNSTYKNIYDDISENTSTFTIDHTYSGLLTFNNPTNSTLVQEAETVNQIRENSPVFLSSQLRLVTENDYEKFLNVNIPNLIADVKVVNNNTFISDYIQYFYDICVDPNKVNRVILNQVNYADSCDFNNINIFCVPRFNLIEDEQYPEFLTNSFKTLIIDITKNKKMISNEVIPRDPIYMALDIGYVLDINNVNKHIYSDCNLIITREKNNKHNKEKIKNDVYNIIMNYFNIDNIKLGQRIDISEMASNILTIDGVRSVKTKNNKTGDTLPGVSFISWNPMFEDIDETLITQTTTLSYFKYPYIFRPKSLINRIIVVDE